MGGKMSTNSNAGEAQVPLRALDDPGRVSTLLEGAAFPAALWSGSELRFTWKNAAFCDLLEDVRPQWDLLGMPVRGFLSDSRAASRFIDVAYTGQPTTEADYEFRPSWGGVTHWQLSYLPIPGKIGSPFDVLLLAVDVSAEMSERAEKEAIAADVRRAISLIDVTVLSSLDAEDILQRVLVEATEALGADWGWIAEREDRAWVFRNVHGWPAEINGMRFSEDELSLPGLVGRSGHALLVTQSNAVKREHFDLMLRHDIGAFALVPIRNRGDVTAVMGFCWDEDAKLSGAHEELLRKLELSLSLALENARQFEKEHILINQLRGAFFGAPKSVPGFEMGRLYHAASGATTVGGDIYDVIPLPEDRLGVLIGDVAGKDPETAALSALVKNAIRSDALHLPSPQTVMDRANELVLHGAEAHEFVSAFFGVIDTVTGEMVYSMAGHPPPVLVRSNGLPELLPDDGGVLGADRSMAFEDHRAMLEQGDMLVLYTDGLIEARSPRGEVFGMERLLHACARLAFEPADSVPEALFLSAFSFSEGHPVDDIAIVALRRGEPADAADKVPLELAEAV